MDLILELLSVLKKADQQKYNKSTVKIIKYVYLFSHNCKY